MTPAELHEQHKSAVLDSPREHHDESRDRLVVEALEAAKERLTAAVESWPRLAEIDALDLVTRALAAMGK